jgi:hypothetical protein
MLHSLSAVIIQSDPLAALAWGLPVGAAWSLGIIVVLPWVAFSKSPRAGLLRLSEGDAVSVRGASQANGPCDDFPF